MESIFFTDETTVYLKTRVKIDGWKKEKKAIFNKGRKINVWGGINYDRILSLYLFYENINSDKYIKILEDALSEINEINRED